MPWSTRAARREVVIDRFERILVGGRGDREDAQPQPMQDRAVDDPWLDRDNLDTELQPASRANEK